MWTLNNALVMVRSFQFKALQLGYHLALGGGVLNKGQSDKDLDIMVLPLDGQNQYKDRLLLAAEKLFGAPVVVTEFVMRYPNGVDLLFYPARVPAVNPEDCHLPEESAEPPAPTRKKLWNAASILAVYGGD